MERLYSIIIPVYNSENIIEETVNTTISTLQNHYLNFEIILINDLSKDNSWHKIDKLAQKYNNIKAINLLKNYGQHTAILCGMANSNGDYLITMDDDLQNPPTEIIKLINKIHEGYDLVFGKFPQKQHKSYRKLGSKIIGYLNKKIFKKPKEITLTNFRIFTSDVAQRVIHYKTFHPYIPGLLLMFSSDIANVETEHHVRKEGHSNYSIWKIWKLVTRLLFNYSSYPMNLLVGIGFFIALISFLLGIGYIIKEVLYGTQVKGWTTLVVMLSFFNGFIIIMLGVLAEYVVQLLKQNATTKPYQIKKISN